MLTWLMFVISLVRFILDFPDLIEELKELWKKIFGETGRRRMKRAREAHALLERIRAERNRRGFLSIPCLHSEQLRDLAKSWK